MPYQAAGLDRSIPFYQAIGNHDHFLIGSFPVYADPSLGLAEAYVADTVWAIPDILVPSPPNYPRIANMDNLRNPVPPVPPARYYQGVIDGSSPTGAITGAGPVGFFDAPPKVAADPGRRSLLKTEWIQEFFDTTSNPVGHGFALVDPDQPEGFACYSFLPNPDVPLKVIVLDDTQSETDGSKDIHGHGFLDANRWAWLQRELDAGQAANQLMIIAAHIPIGVTGPATGIEWWDSAADPDAVEQNAVSLTELVAKLQATPNFLVWLAGHRHFNVVKAFPPIDPGERDSAPWKGFWQVETSSLRDYPQQLRTFEIFLNGDYTVSIVTTNVDPAVRAGTPAATSRAYSVAAQQIVQNDLIPNNVNQSMINKAPFDVPPVYYPPAYAPIPTMDPTRPQVPEGCYVPVPPRAWAASRPVPGPEHRDRGGPRRSVRRVLQRRALQAAQPGHGELPQGEVPAAAVTVAGLPARGEREAAAPPFQEPLHRLQRRLGIRPAHAHAEAVGGGLREAGAEEARGGEEDARLFHQVPAEGLHALRAPVAGEADAAALGALPVEELRPPAKKASKRGRLPRTIARFRAWMASPCRRARAARNSPGPELEMEV